MNQRRLYVRKREAAQVREAQLLSELNEFLAIESVVDLASYRRYVVFDELSDEEWKSLVTGLFTEAPVDLLSESESFFELYDELFAISPLPAQFDPCRAAAEDAAALILDRKIEAIHCAEVIALKGDISTSDLIKIKNHLINPIEARESSITPPFSQAKLEEREVRLREFPELFNFAEEDLPDFLEEHQLGLSLADLILVRDYFKAAGRIPNELELRVLDTYWSDHCRHSSFNTELEIVETERLAELSDLIAETMADLNELRRELERQGEVSLMELATLPTRAMRAAGEIPDVEFSAEINAATLQRKLVVDGEKEDYLILFKNETHNHPTEIEPEGGAATCLGGAIRDPLSGRAHVFQAMRVSGAANPNTSLSETLPGKLPQRKICQAAAEGYSSYGNRMGLAGSHVREYYHPDFVAKRFECGAVLAAVAADQVVKEVPEAGDLVILVGGDTGRDGIGGATGSSREQTEETILTAGSEVQKGNPINERKLQRLFLRPEFTRLIKRCNDFGAGGVAVAVGELCRGLSIDLSKVPLKYQGLSPLEIALSESQERMAIVIAKESLDTVLELAQAENVKASVIAEVTREAVLIMKYKDEEVLRLDRSFLDSEGAQRSARAKLRYDSQSELLKPRVEAESFQDLVEGIFSRLESSDQRGLQEIFDASVGCSTVASPYGGKLQASPEMGICAKIPTRGESNAVAWFTHGYDPQLAADSPWHGALYAITTSLLKILAMGGDPRRARLSMQEYFPRLDNEEAWGQAYLTMLSAFRAQRKFKVPAIGGKDSVSGSFNEISVPPSLVSFAVDSGELADYRPASLPEGKELTIYRWNLLNADGDIDFERYHKELPSILALMRDQQTVSAFVGEADGILAACGRAAFGNQHGLKFSSDLELEDLARPAFASLFIARAVKLAPVEVRALGLSVIAASNGESRLAYATEELALDRISEIALNALSEVYPMAQNQRGHGEKNQEYLWDKLQESSKQMPAKSWHAPVPLKAAKPKVIIPCFPGTNCEFDTAGAFNAAGAESEIFIFNNLNAKLLQASLDGLAKRVRTAEILALPGGFSAGDEPDGAAKFIRAVFYNEALRAAFSDHLAKENLVLGICNGFQALIKLGVFKDNEICELNEDDITLSFNSKGGHIACCVETESVFAHGPWLAGLSAGAKFKIPISHGEGRIIGSDQALDRLIKEKQIAFTYSEYNPNGSALSIEALTSPNGLILGKMGHSERVRPGLMKNIPGLKAEGIFEAGVKYFMS
ncbi:MAG: phosphoribosylformylglycinamidine synthase [Eubacteriales bacterium]|nr:phosphoribosylformylglycinamidine synthase [Eubacteriales bacterium]